MSARTPQTRSPEVQIAGMASGASEGRLMSGCSSPAATKTWWQCGFKSLPDRYLPAARGRLDRSSDFQSNGGLGNCPIDNFNRFHKTGGMGSNGRIRGRLCGRLTPKTKPRAIDTPRAANGNDLRDNSARFSEDRRRPRYRPSKCPDDRKRPWSRVGTSQVA